MTNDDYMIAYRIGDDAAREVWGRLPELSPDRDDAEGFADRVHPQAFADALDALPNEDAPDVSDAVQSGIVDYWRAARVAARALHRGHWRERAGYRAMVAMRERYGISATRFTLQDTGTGHGPVERPVCDDGVYQDYGRAARVAA